jgi:hypothetical protein
MKTLIIALLLSLAPELNAQAPQLLQMDTTTYGPVTNWIGGSDGENGSGVKQVGQRPGLAFMMWHLPTDKPDSLRFVFRSNTPVQLWTLNCGENDYCRLKCGLISDTFVSVTVAYEQRDPSTCYAATGLATCALRTPDSNGYIEVDAVYAVWATPDTATTLTVNADSLESEEAEFRAWRAMHPCKWYTVAGAVYLEGTTTQLEQLRPKVALYGSHRYSNGKVWPGSVTWTGTAFCVRRECEIKEEEIR